MVKRELSKFERIFGYIYFYCIAGLFTLGIIATPFGLVFNIMENGWGGMMIFLSVLCVLLYILVIGSIILIRREMKQKKITSLEDFIFGNE